MAHSIFVIEIEGQEIPDIYEDIVHLEVESAPEMANLFRMRLLLRQQEDGTWSHLDDERFKVWNQLTIRAGFEGSDVEELFFGYITNQKPFFDPDPSECWIEIWGMDSSVLMDRQIVTKEWASRKDSDIAGEIFRKYNLTPRVEDTGIVHDEEVSTILQRETDIQFLRRLAARNAFDCYIEGQNGYFGPAGMDEEIQPLLAVHCREETNVTYFSINTDALLPVNVKMAQIDRLNKEIHSVTVTESPRAALGRDQAPGLLKSGMDPGLYLATLQTATGNAEMLALCEGTYTRAENFVSGEGEISGFNYGYILHNRKLVTIKGLGETYSGIYYVTHVTHTFTPEGYSQHFKVARNALGITGSENFSGYTS